MLFTVFTPLLNKQEFTFNMEVYFNLFLSDSAFIIWAVFYHISYHVIYLCSEDPCRITNPSGYGNSQICLDNM